MHTIYNVLLDHATGPPNESLFDGAIFFTIFGFIGLLYIEVRERLDLRAKRGVYILAPNSWLIVGFCCACWLGAAAYNHWRPHVLDQMKRDYSSGRYEIFDGCVHDFSETIDEHNVATDTFGIGGQLFSITGGPWPIGYRETRHTGSPLGPMSCVRIWANDQRILRIDIR